MCSTSQLLACHHHPGPSGLGVADVGRTEHTAQETEVVRYLNG
jgi:hypothetical protein